MVPQCFFRIYTSRRSRKKNSRSRNRSSPPIIMPSPSNARIMLVYSAGKSKYNTLRVYDELLEGANCAPYLCSSNLWKIDIKFRPQWSFESTNGQEDSTFTWECAPYGTSWVSIASRRAPSSDFRSSHICLRRPKCYL